MTRIYRDKETLEYLYYEKEMQKKKIADRCGCTRHTIQRWMNKFDMEKRLKPHQKKENIVKLYYGEEMSVYEVADELGYSSTSGLRYWMDKHDIERRGESYEKIPRTDLIDELQRLSDELDSVPTYWDMNDFGEYSGKTYQSEFGSWVDACTAAGLDPNRAPPIEYECDNCGDVFERSRYYKKNNNNFCSKECNKQYSRTTVECDFCGDNFECRDFYSENGLANFCSDGCYRNHHSETHSGENSARWAGRIEVECHNCGESLRRQPSEVKDTERHFCTHNCHFEWKRETDENVGDYSLRESGYYYGPNFQRQREKALERDGHECRQCGISNETHKKIHGEGLHCHHRRDIKYYEEDGVMNYEDANALSNLIMLCEDCHLNKWDSLPVSPPA